jgi:hypothetical protein
MLVKGVDYVFGHGRLLKINVSRITFKSAQVAISFSHIGAEGLYLTRTQVFEMSVSRIRCDIGASRLPLRFVFIIGAFESAWIFGWNYATGGEILFCAPMNTTSGNKFNNNSPYEVRRFREIEIRWCSVRETTRLDFRSCLRVILLRYAYRAPVRATYSN